MLAVKHGNTTYSKDQKVTFFIAINSSIESLEKQDKKAKLFFHHVFDHNFPKKYSLLLLFFPDFAPGTDLSDTDRPTVIPQAQGQGHLPLAVSPRFNWKDVETCYVGSNSIGEEQLTRQLIGLHRAVTHKDKNLLNNLVKQGAEMSLPLRGVTALSLSLYLRHLEMTSELLAALRRSKQLGKKHFV